MLRLGICTREQYLRARKRGNISGSAISFNLLQVSDNATEEEIQRFEEIHYYLRTANGIFRTTFRHRFSDVDAAATELLAEIYRPDTQLYIQDRAASHALTSCEWAELLFKAFPRAEFEASDTILHFLQVTLPNETYIVEPNGQPLQCIKPPFVLSLSQREPYCYGLNHLMAARAKWRFRRLPLAEILGSSKAGGAYSVGKICCVHPQARFFSKKYPQFRVNVRSVFDYTPGVDVVRTMNILNTAYFSQKQLIEAAKAVFRSLKPGGIWIVGRTLEHDFSNHVTFYRRADQGWDMLQRVGDGWEMEELVYHAAAQCQQGSL
jgi:hypothetical protein